MARNSSAAVSQENDYWASTICAGCYGLCGVKVRVVDGVPVEIEGQEHSDLGGRGGQCGKGVATIMDYHDPNRINYPVRRTNPEKGIGVDPKWRRISWDEALREIADKLKEAIKEDPRSILWNFTPGPGTAFKATHFVSGFFISMGSLNHAFGGVGSQCGAAAHHLGALMHAAWDILPDYGYCNFLLRCGGNEGHGGGRMAATAMRRAADARARGMKTVVMDPVGFRAAGDADEWIPILPGTDIAVFLAIANLIVHKIGTYDADYIRHKTNGSYLVGPDELFVRDQQSNKPLLMDETDGKAKTYDDPTLSRPAILGHFKVNGVECQPGFQIWKDSLPRYTAKWASDLSTVPAARIEKLATELVDAAKIGSTISIEGKSLPYRPAVVCGYKGLQSHTNSFHQYTAMMMVNILLGNQDVPGGLLGSGTVRGFGHPDTGRPSFAPYGGEDGMLTPGVWFTKTPWPPKAPTGPTQMNLLDLFVHSSMNVYPYADDFQEIWTKAGRPYETKVMGIYGGNPVMNCVNENTVVAIISKIPFVFSMNTVHNETTESFADIVLPDVHAYESYDCASSTGYFFNYPIGMEDWCFHVRLPVVEPKYERRDTLDVLFQLSDMVGTRGAFNKFLDGYYSTREMKWEQDLSKTKDEYAIIGPDDKISSKEVVDKVLKYYFGEERGLDWFKTNGFMSWKKKPEECYWRYEVDARVPIYFDHHVRDRDVIRNTGEKLGMHMEWEQYSPIVGYYPSLSHTEAGGGSEYDVFGVSYRDPLHTHRFSAQNPIVDEMSKHNPYSYTVVVHLETAKAKGIREGDTISIENSRGDKVLGTAKLSVAIHPKAIAMVGLGGWALGRPVAKGKGVNFNHLLIGDIKHMCPVVGSLEITPRLKIARVEGAS